MLGLQEEGVRKTGNIRLGFLWHRHVQSQSDNQNPLVQALLERLWLLILFLSPFVEGPLNYFLGTVNTDTNTNTITNTQRQQRKPAAAKQPLVT
jgi:hypothetical protein